MAPLDRAFAWPMRRRYVESMIAPVMRSVQWRRFGIVLAIIAAALTPSASAAPPAPPANAGFDYQIGGAYPLPPGITVVTRDWFADSPAPLPVYSICYVNAFQTQADEADVNRPDERGNWPRGLVLKRLGDDPKWGGEYLVDITSAAKRAQAARWVAPMLVACRQKGYQAVEFDNLDSWQRFDDTPLAKRVPFGKRQALAYARTLTARAHALGLAVGQKNTPELTHAQVRRVGFDFAVAEECARYKECDRYRRLFGNRVIDIEYRAADFRRACAAVGPKISVVFRDLGVSMPGARRYRFRAC